MATHEWTVELRRAADAVRIALPGQYPGLPLMPLIEEFLPSRSGADTRLASQVRMSLAPAEPGSAPPSGRLDVLSGRWLVGEPKTDAGRRMVTLPAGVSRTLAKHLERFVPDGADALVFGTSSGGFLSPADFAQTFRRAVRAVGLPPVRPHELRHTGATLAAATGASTKELMRRLGHSTAATALIYQHAADERDAEIARALDALLDGSQARLT